MATFPALAYSPSTTRTSFYRSINTTYNGSWIFTTAELPRFTQWRWTRPTSADGNELLLRRMKPRGSTSWPPGKLCTQVWAQQIKWQSSNKL